MTQLQNRALLVQLNISQWTARKLDRSESDEVARRNNATSGSARVNKSLLPTAHRLEIIHKMTGNIRTDYYKHTLPWVDGLGIIKTDGYLDFCRMIGEHKLAWQTAVGKFIDDYGDCREEAKFLLGSLYKDADYPDKASLAAKFKFDVGFYPVPSASDWRVDLSDEHMDCLQRQIAERVAESQGKAMQEAWQRVFDVVSKAHERLSDPDNIFRDSLIENAQELCRILPSLNIADDPALEVARQQIEGSLCQYSPDTLREDTAVRSAAAAQLDDLMKRMGVMYGAS